MKDSRYKIILYVILIVIVGTIGIQVYWNLKNYNINKQQLINEVQLSLDNAVETYYADLAEHNTIGFAINENLNKDDFGQNKKFDSLLGSLKFNKNSITNLDSIKLNVQETDGIKIFKGKKADSLLKSLHDSPELENQKTKNIELNHYYGEKSDSLAIDDFKILTSKVIISLTQDSLNVNVIDSILKKELTRKNITIDYGLTFSNANEKPYVLNKNIINESSLSAESKSTFLPKDSSLKIDFTNSTKVILKRILSGILLSIVLILAVISCLFFLLKIIKRQKQIAEVKNDFISNITHEFKTPISTIGVALESIKNFNVLNDTKKTKSYLDISNIQLSKLNTMVEKLLETATLDSETLLLDKDKINVSELIQNLVNKHSLDLIEKSITFIKVEKDIYANIDVFHFENALDNIIDNAIKYGGNEIKVNLQQNDFGFAISVSDNGNNLAKANKNKIFEKFYRVPKGNTHDVKGFGIGLYYTKKIIEKHHGTIHLNLDHQWTTFNITMPYGNA